MSSSSNPILNTINDVLGLGHAPKTFSEKIGALEMSMATSTSTPFKHYIDVLRKDAGVFGASQGAQQAKSKVQIDFLYDKLTKAGLLPATAGSRDLFDSIDRSGGSLLFNESGSHPSLFYSTGDKVSALPLQLDNGLVSIGGKARKVNSLNIGGSSFGFTEAFYDGIAGYSNSLGSLHTNARRGLRILNPLSGVNIRGIGTPEEGWWTANRYISRSATRPSTDIGLALSKYRTATSSFSMLVKTGGKSVFGDLRNLASNQTLQYEDAFDLIRKYKEEYFGSMQGGNFQSGYLAQYLSSQGMLKGVPYVKPDYLGNKKKLLMASQGMVDQYGSFFEEGTLSKGLFQLAKIKDTSAHQLKITTAVNDASGLGISSHAGYLTAGQDVSDIYRKNRLFKVAVVDTINPVDSLAYFGEGGGFLTDVGAATMGSRHSAGTIKLASPSQEMIGSIERLFGTSLGGPGMLTNLDVKPNFTTADLGLASSKKVKFEDLTPVQQDLRALVKGGKKYQGFLRQVVKEQHALSKIELTDSMLSLDFKTGTNVVSESIAAILGARRYTLTGTRGANVFKGRKFGGAQVITAGDEFAKNYGANVLLSNFIGVINEDAADEAEQIFKETFGVNSTIHKRAISSNKNVYIPHVVDHDTAFTQVRSILQTWTKNGTERQKQLLDTVVHGKVVNEVGIAGVKQVRTFFMMGGLRTDPMHDINIMNPVRMSLSKLSVLAQGARRLGYSSHLEHPLFKMFQENSPVLSSGILSFAEGSGALRMGENHHLAKFARAMIGKPGNINPNDIVTLGNDGFYHNGNKLTSLPKEVSAFSHSRGGVERQSLKGSILDRGLIKSPVVYIDLGKEVKLNLFGESVTGGERSYRYLPVHMDYLRMEMGAHGRVTSGKSHPAYSILKSLISMESGWSTIKDGSRSPIDYEDFLKATMGKGGLFDRSSVMTIKSGARVRLAPDSAGYFTPEKLLDPEAFYHGTMSKTGFQDFMARKSNMMSKSTKEAINRSIKDRGYFYTALAVDPAQRSEHMVLTKTFVGSHSGTPKIGQLNYTISAFLARVFERDLDNDAATMIPVHPGERGYDSMMPELDDLYARQVKSIKPFIGYHHLDMLVNGQVKPVNSGARLSKMAYGVMEKIFGKVEEYLGVYVGVNKSLGYSISRAVDNFMPDIVAGGTSAAAKLGIIGKGISEETIEKVIAPFLKDPATMDIAKDLMQNLFQGAVQKGVDKSGLVGLAEGLVKLGQKYKGAKLNNGVDAVTAEAKTLLLDFLSTDGNKTRAFGIMDHFVEKGIITNQSRDLLLRGLQHGAAVNEAEFKAVKSTVLNATADLLAPLLGSGFAIAASMPAIRNILGITQKTVRPDTSMGEVIQNLIDPVTGEKFLSAETEHLGSTSPTPVDDVSAEAAKAKLGQGNLAKVKSFFNKGGTKLAIGLGIGAAVGAGIVSLMGGPIQTPRDVDGRQPTDMGPEVFSPPPKIYGTNQNFGARGRRSPETFSSVGPYNFSSSSQSSITTRDKLAPNNPYLLEQQMRNVARRDFNY